jgi:hypothetical protein
MKLVNTITLGFFTLASVEALAVPNLHARTVSNLSSSSIAMEIIVVDISSSASTDHIFRKHSALALHIASTL